MVKSAAPAPSTLTPISSAVPVTKPALKPATSEITVSPLDSLVVSWLISCTSNEAPVPTATAKVDVAVAASTTVLWIDTVVPSSDNTASA